MSGSTARAAALGAAKTSRSGWLASIKEESLSFLKGDNNAPWAILASTVIGFVPILGQVADARDIIKGLVEVSAAPASPLAWFNLITALIGLIPGGGDAAKGSLRAIKAGTMHTDDLLSMIRRFYKGDPEKLLLDVLDISKVRKVLDDILTNPKLVRNLGPQARKSIDSIRANLAKQFDAFKKEVEGWLAKGRKTSAETGAAVKPTRGTPQAKPATHTKTGSKGNEAHSNSASPNTPNAATQRTARFKQLSQKVLGVLGEHMADYHCEEIKAWGSKTVHDTGAVNTAKLNDSGRMVQLWPCIPRGRGIDAVWKAAGGRKPYAIVEAKASYNPLKSLAALLGDAGDKTEAANPATGSQRKKGRNSANRSATTGPDVTRQVNGKVTQMSHGWIQRRLSTTVLTDPRAKTRLLIDRERAYSRHVLFFSIPHAVSHAEALILLTAQKSVPNTFHGAHQLTRQWGDSDIDKVVNDRAGIDVSGRGSMKSDRRPE